ncbi:sulfoxide reductase heme-binding subunit YedZ [Acidovorax sp. Be4]|uniref:Protein-methionine-sulfoxide reductase heme-binding subunit MsrQ n=1 Tax=Acidovorax bellezanensis TaxID=2976702 RepID=A0ABT2PTW7_9BURK|nr:protein-methionine-sulfoxide reductase heme-binding subunit MsrQ [Acidovorax sp. Be4]MCT9813289.1 sulfoxide reductase heme-binding subunit YedZ [Acidovorax sp. Be4]
MPAVLSRWKAWLMHPAAKPLLFVLCLLPFANLFAGAVFDTLGPNPAEALIRAMGDWTLRFLCVVLAVTPLRVQLGLPALARFRRMLGLFVYFYAVLHLLCYSVFDQGLDFGEIWRDILKRPFILVGMLAFGLLTALALTSPHRMTRWMGARRWQRLHRCVYAVAGLAILHFFWMRAGKNNFTEVAVYGAILALLLGWRLQRWLRKRWATVRPEVSR